MAKSNAELITALRVTAQRLGEGAHYEWGHMGRCNCGHLVQTITNLSAREIVAAADNKLDEWSEHARDYCAGTGQNVESLFLTLHKVGFDYQDVIHLENLTDARVLNRLAEGQFDGGRRYLQRNCVTDVTQYMNTLADLLEEELVDQGLVGWQPRREAQHLLA
jgi:hypothetical protein